MSFNITTDYTTYNGWESYKKDEIKEYIQHDFLQKKKTYHVYRQEVKLLRKISKSLQTYNHKSQACVCLLGEDRNMRSERAYRGFWCTGNVLFCNWMVFILWLFIKVYIYVLWPFMYACYVIFHTFFKLKEKQAAGRRLQFYKHRSQQTAP